MLVFQPKKLSKLQSEWRGPVLITKKLTEVTYQVDLGQSPKRFWTFHVNSIKTWNSPILAVFLSVEDIINEDNVEKKKENQVNTLTYEQEGELSRLKESFSGVTSDVPGRTSMVEHTIHTGDAFPIRLPPYCLPHSSHEYLRKEIKTLLEQKIIVPSKAPGQLQ